MKYLKKNKIKILILTLYIASRIFSLGHDTFNTDVWKWKSRSFDFGSGVFGLDFKKTDQKYHPGVTLMWLGSLGVKIFNLYTDFKYPSQDIDSLGLTYVFGLHFVQKFLVVIVTGLSLVSIYTALKKLFNKKYALLTIFLISVEPFYVALSRIFHLEGLLSTFMLASVIWLYAYFVKKNNRYFLLSAIFGGLALLTKTSAIYLIPFVGLGSFVYFIFHNDSIQVSLISGLKLLFPWFGITFIVFFTLWPALWVDFVNVMQNLYRGITSIGVSGDHYQIYFGNLVEDPGFLYYIVVFLLRSSPYVIFGCIGYLLVRKRIENREYKIFAFYMFLYSLFYIIQHTLPTKKLDRYILPALIGLIPIISLYFYFVFEKIKFHKNIIIGIFLLFPLYILVRVHPDYLSYYNPIFGGLRVGSRILEPKWLIGKDEIICFFKNIQEQNNLYTQTTCKSFECVISEKSTDEVLSVGFPEKYRTQIYPFFTEINGWAIIKELTPFAKETKYFVYPIWYDDSYLEDRFKIEYVDSIYVRKVPLYNVYERIKE